jgi:hypothetical protein
VESFAGDDDYQQLPFDLFDPADWREMHEMEEKGLDFHAGLAAAARYVAGSYPEIPPYDGTYSWAIRVWRFLLSQPMELLVTNGVGVGAVCALLTELGDAYNMPPFVFPTHTWEWAEEVWQRAYRTYVDCFRTIATLMREEGGRRLALMDSYAAMMPQEYDSEADSGDERRMLNNMVEE